MDKYITPAMFAFCVVIAVVGWRHDEKHPSYCAEQSTVKEILELKYRGAKIRLTSGREVWVNQATLKPGDAFCVRYERK